MSDPLKGEKSKAIHIELMRGIHRLGQLGRKLSFLPLSRGEYCILCLLSHMSREGKLVYVSYLACHMEVSPPAISRLLRGLEKKGYISRETGIKDRRNTMVCLTEAGKDILSQSEEALRCFVEDLISAFTEEKTNQLIELINELSQLAEERIGDGA